MKKATYIRCPRCELNYILKKDKFCSVCKQEMQVGGGDFDDLDLELCPICKANYIQPDEVMCATCMAERASDPNFDKNNDDWDAYLSRDDEDMGDDENEDVDEMSTVKLLDDEDDDIVDDDEDFDDLDVMGEEILDDEDEKEESFDEDDEDFDDYDDDDDEDDD